jgi:hypothetical protein
MHRRILALAAGVMLAGGLAPAAHATIKKPKVQPPSCNTTIGNVVGGDPICEPTDLEP